MKQLSNVRKADKAHGDDLSLTRWVKMPGRHTSGKAVAPMPANATGSRFKTRVIHPDDMGAILVSGHSNVKIGRDVRRGPLTGYWIYTLSLEERATCPTSCEFWRTCYGNAMPFAKRVMHGRALLDKLDAEIASLLATRGRKGILIRLHALGDFYSEGYVEFWQSMLAKYPRLSIFGYTARTPDSPIGHALLRLMGEFSDRAFVRWSNGGLADNCTVTALEPVAPAGSFLCPEQTGQTKCCATCAACWSTRKNVAFQNH